MEASFADFFYCLHSGIISLTKTLHEEKESFHDRRRSFCQRKGKPLATVASKLQKPRINSEISLFRDGC